MKENFMRGAAFIATSFFIVKFLGFIYVVPFVAMVGEHNYLLYAYAYKPFSIMIMFATLGIPSAVSKYVAKHKEKAECYKNKFLLLNGSIIMLLFGFISFVILFMTSNWIAEWLVGNQIDQSGNSVEDVASVIQYISFALLVVPLLYLMRGFIQGHQKMFPTAVSQVVEQIIRVGIILIGTYLVLYVWKLEPIIAVKLSTFAAFIAALGGVIVLILFMCTKDFRYIRKKDEPEKKKFSRKEVYTEVGKYAIPFIFTGAMLTFIQTIDMFLINNALVEKGIVLKEAELINAIISLVQKIVILPVAIASALGVSLVSYISASYEANRIHQVRENITKSFQTIFFFVLPASMGLIILSKPIYATVYGVENVDIGGNLLSWYGIAPIFYSLYSITAIILQGMNKTRWIFISLLVGLFIKIALFKPFVMLYDGVGTAYSTYFGLGFSILIQMYVIQKEGRYNILENVESIKKIAVQTVYMTLLILPIGLLSLSTYNYWHNVFLSVCGVLSGSGFYFWLSLRNRSLVKLFPRFEKIFKTKTSS